MGSATSVVTANVDGSDVTPRGVYIYGFPRFTVTHPSDLDGDGVAGDTGLGSKENRANEGSTITTPFTATVTDGADDPAGVSDVVVKFQASGSETGGGYLVFEGNMGTLVTSNNRLSRGPDGAALTTDTAKILYVRTDSDGVADVGFEFGTDEKTGYYC